MFSPRKSTNYLMQSLGFLYANFPSQNNHMLINENKKLFFNMKIGI